MGKYPRNYQKSQNRGKYKPKKDKRSGKQAPTILYLLPILISAVILFLAIKNGDTLEQILNVLKGCLIFSVIIVVAISIIWKIIYRNMLLGADIKKIDNMTGEEFEEYLALLYKSKGFVVKMTPKTCDFGADLLLTDKDGTKICIQAKRYRGLVGEAAVQQTLSGMNYYDCDKAMIVTNSHYTDAAKALAKKCNIKMIDRFKLGTNKMYEF